MPFVVVSGLSGSGKSTVLRALEDAGFFITDNLPPELWGTLHDLAQARGLKRVAVSTDTRTREFLGALGDSYARLSRRREDLRVLFLDAADDVLLKRYNLTRREHPLGDTLMVDFARERELLAPLRSIADTVIDTTSLSAKELADRVLRLFRLEHDFHLRLLSFGFKHAPPRDVDLVLDVRSLPNPHYDADLRARTGLEQDVARYVFQNEEAEGFYAGLRDFVRLSAERARASGRHGYTVAVGCTGGQHRSVAVATRLAGDLRDLNVDVTEHRDMPLGTRVVVATAQPGGPQTTPPDTGATVGSAVGGTHLEARKAAAQRAAQGAAPARPGPDPARSDRSSAERAGSEGDVPRAGDPR